MNSRRKGAVGEREIAKYLREHGYDAHRGQQYKGGADSPDVTGIPGYHIEVKRVERLDLKAAMEQSIRDAGDDIPIVIHRRDRDYWKVTMRLDDFVELERRSHEHIRLERVREDERNGTAHGPGEGDQARA